MAPANQSHNLKIALHYVDDDIKSRAQFSQIATELGYHCELYDDLHELLDYSPHHGLIIFRDAPDNAHPVSRVFEEIQKSGMWLAVIIVGHSPEPAQIVEAIKAGALDYLSLPIDATQLQRRLARSADEAIRISNLRRESVEAQRLIEKLSARENEVLTLLSDGHSNKAIARELGISPRTVEIHRANMMDKLGATHSARAVRIKLDAERLLLA